MSKIMGMPNADVLAQIAAIIVAISGLFTAVTAAFVKLKVDKTHDIAEATAKQVATSNGSTMGENSDAVRDVIAPKVDGPVPSPGA